jgi:hypothetical protein
MENWKRQFIRLLFHYSAHRIRPKEADLVKHPNVPSALFRRFCDQHKEALVRGVLWRASPSHFNDHRAAGTFAAIRLQNVRRMFQTCPNRQGPFLLWFSR